jgi:hypothetical protein
MARPPRPVPLGTNARGTPLWNGNELADFRVAHGVPVGETARAIYTSSSEVAGVYESGRVPLGITYDRVEKYCLAVERIRARRDERAAEALARLRTRTSAPPSPGPGRVRTRAEADAALAERRSREKAASR